jgi:hypothetical protein
MRNLLATLVLVCLCLTPLVSAQNTDAASDRVVVVGNPSQPVAWNHKSNIREAILRAQPNGTVIIPSSYSGTDCNPISSCSLGSVIVIDWRTGGGSSSLACGNSFAVYIFNGSGTICDLNFLDNNGALTAISLAAQSLTISSTAQFNLGARLGPLTFANLGSPGDGTYVFCPDCQALNPCIGGGTGAFAQRVNSQWLCSTSGGGGGSTTPGGADTNVQINASGVLNGFSAFTFNHITSTVGLPDGTTWSPTAVTFPASGWVVDGPGHLSVIHQLNNTGQLNITAQGAGEGAGCGGQLLLFGTNNASAASSSQIIAYNCTGVGAHTNAQWWVSPNRPFVDRFGYNFTGGLMAMYGETTPLNFSNQIVFGIDLGNESTHFYGPIVFPSGSGNSFSYGATGAVPLSQGSGTPVEWSSDVSGVFALNGVFGTCPSPPANTQSAFCFGPAGKIFGSYGGDAFNGMVRENNIPAAGITGTIEPSQIDQTNPGGLGGLYAPLNPVSQYNVPEWGAANVGPVTGPFNDAVDNVVTLAKPLDLGTQALTIDVPNCSSTGTTANKLVKFASSAGATCAVLASVVDTQGEMGICVARCGTTGTAVIAFRGKVSLVMDGATTVNDWVINSPSVAGNGRDTASTTCPTSGAQVIGRVLSTNAAGGTFTVQLGGCDTSGGAGGGGGSPGGSSGQIEWNNAGVFAGFTASGDFTLVPSTGIGTVTGLNGTNLAGLATGILCNTTGTGVPTVCTAIPNGDTATTQAANSNDTKVATNAYADRVIAKPLLTGNSSVNVVRISGSDYTQTASAQTAITGLSWTLPANTAANYQFSCLIVGNEATSTTVQTFSINDVTVAPTGGMAGGWAVATNGTAFIGSKSLGSITATGSQTAVTFTPSAAGANFLVHIDGMIEQPSNASTSAFQVELGVGGGTNTVTLKKDSYCTLTQN